MWALLTYARRNEVVKIKIKWGGKKKGGFK